jgi:flagellar biosynthesis protein FlhB
MGTPRRDWLGGLVGIATFLVGIALLLFVFKLAFDTFTEPVNSALGLQPGEKVELEKTGQLGVALIVRVVMLFVMCIIASLIASRGIKLYAQRIEFPRKTPAPPQEHASQHEAV